MADLFRPAFIKDYGIELVQGQDWAIGFRCKPLSDQGVLSDTQVTMPERAISDAEFARAKATLKTMVQTFYPGGVPTGSPTNAQIRNWLLSLTAAVRYLYNEMDTD